MRILQSFQAFLTSITVLCSYICRIRQKFDDADISVPSGKMHGRPSPVVACINEVTNTSNQLNLKMFSLPAALHSFIELYLAESRQPV